MSTATHANACHFCGTDDAPMSTPHFTDRATCLRINVCDSQECRARVQYTRPRKPRGDQGPRPVPQRPTVGAGDLAGWGAAAQLSRLPR